jgi:TRAP-type C4-dicarboxylate transport system substrate-binding protein
MNPNVLAVERAFCFVLQELFPLLSFDKLIFKSTSNGKESPMFKKVFQKTFVFTVVVLTILTFATSTQAEVKKLKMATSTPEKSSVSPLIAKMAEAMGTYSDGTVEVKVYWAGEIAQVKDLSDLCRKGSVDMMIVPLVHFPSMFPLNSILCMYSVLLPSPDEAAYVWRGLLRDIPEVQGEVAKQNQYALNRMVLSNYLTISKKPIRGMGDFKGMKVRGMPGRYFSKLMENVGATNVPIPFPEIYEAFMRGALDAVMLIPQDFVAMKYDELGKYISLSAGCIVGVNCNINLDTWKGLSPKGQQALMRAATEWGANSLENQLTSFDKSVNELKSKGIEFIEFNKQDWQKMLADAGDPWDAAKATLTDDLKVAAPVAESFMSRWHELHEEYQNNYVSTGKKWVYE